MIDAQMHTCTIAEMHAEPFRATQGGNEKNRQFVALSSNSSTDRSLKKEVLFCVRTVVDAMVATIFFSCQSLPSGTAQGIVPALKRSIAHAGVELDVWMPFALQTPGHCKP